MKHAFALLPLAITSAVVAGAVWGHADPSAVGSVRHPSLGPIVLVAMLLSPFARIRLDTARALVLDRRAFARWTGIEAAVGPALMFGLAAVCLHNHPQYMTGLILVGLGRPVARWVDDAGRAGGDPAGAAAGRAAVNAVWQVLTYGAYVWLLAAALPPRLGLRGVPAHLGGSQVVGGLFLCLIVTFGLAWLARPAVGPLSVLSWVALTFTTAAVVAVQGRAAWAHLHEVGLIVLPLVVYAAVMFAVGRRAAGPAGGRSAAGWNAELALAAAITVFGIDHGAAFPPVVALAVEAAVVPALVWLGGKADADPTSPAPWGATTRPAERPVR